MPTVEPPDARVLVTGANGYIGMWITRTLLERGYAVRAVVRSLEKGKHLKDYFTSYGEKLELFVVEDIEKDGAFDEAVKGVDAIEHTAMHVALFANDPDEFTKPALQGTLSLLNSALKFGDKIKRIVITATASTIFQPVKEPTVTFDETFWADWSVGFVKEKGKDAGALTMYSAAKTLAERAAWDFQRKHKDEIGWDLVVVHPPFVFGPPIQEAKTPANLNASLQLFWNIIAINVPEEILKDTYGFVDVRDVAKVHVEALRKEEAGGERILASNGSFTGQGLRDFTHSVRPDLYTSGVLPRGEPNSVPTVLFKYNAEKSKRIFGLEYIDREKTIRDTIADFEAKGWLQKNANA